MKTTRRKLISLNDKERLEIAARIVHNNLEIDRIEEEKKKLPDLKEENLVLSKEYDSGEGYRNVEVNVTFNLPEPGQKTIQWNHDGLDEIDVEAMTEEDQELAAKEMQGTLEFDNEDKDEVVTETEDCYFGDEKKGGDISDGERYRFNKFGVCINPTSAIKYKNPKSLMPFYEIFYCKKDDKYYLGHSYDFKSGGGSSPAGIVVDEFAEGYDEYYTDLQTGVIETLKYIRNSLGSEDNTIKRKIRKHINETLKRMGAD